MCKHGSKCEDLGKINFNGSAVCYTWSTHDTGQLEWSWYINIIFLHLCVHVFCLKLPQLAWLNFFLELQYCHRQSNSHLLSCISSRDLNSGPLSDWVTIVAGMNNKFILFVWILISHSKYRSKDVCEDTTQKQNWKKFFFRQRERKKVFEKSKVLKIFFGKNLWQRIYRNSKNLSFEHFNQLLTMPLLLMF